MISLNLLPRERKEIFRWRQYTKKVILNGIKTIFLLICFFVPLFAVDIYLSGEINAINTQIDSYENMISTRQMNTMEKSFKQLNNTLIKINKISSEQIGWIGVFEEINSIIPSNIQIFSLQIEPNGSFTIIGNAKTREDVLEFGKRFKESSDFSDTLMPPDVFTKKEDINFNFKGNIIFNNFKIIKK